MSKSYLVGLAAWSGVAPASTRRAGWELTWVVLGQASAMLCAVAGLRLLTQFVAPAVYGELALGMTATMLVHQTLIGPLANAVTRFFAPAREAGELPSYYTAVWRLLNRATCLLAGVGAVVVAGCALLGFRLWIPLAVAGFLLAAISGYSSVLDGMQNAARQRVIVAWHQMLGQFSRFVLAAALVMGFGASGHVALLGFALGAVIVLASQYLFYKTRMPATHDGAAALNWERVRDWSAELWAYGWPFATWGIFTWAQLSSDRWALQTFRGSDAVGHYAVAYQLGYLPMSLLAGLMMQLVVPVLFSRVGNATQPQRVEQTRRLNWLLIAATIGGTLLGCTVAFFLHPWLFSFLVAPPFRDASYLMPPMMLAGGLSSAAQVALLSPLIHSNSRLLIAPKIVTALLGVLGSCAGAFFFGLNGTVWAQVVFSLVSLVWALCLFRRPSEA